MKSRRSRRKVSSFSYLNEKYAILVKSRQFADQSLTTFFSPNGNRYAILVKSKQFANQLLTTFFFSRWQQKKYASFSLYIYRAKIGGVYTCPLCIKHRNTSLPAYQPTCTPSIFFYTYYSEKVRIHILLVAYFPQEVLTFD